MRKAKFLIGQTRVSLWIIRHFGKRYMIALPRVLAITLMLIFASGCAPFERIHKLYVECGRPDGSGVGMEFFIDAASPERFEAVPNEGVFVTVDQLDPVQERMTVTVSAEDLPAKTIELRAGDGGQWVDGGNRHVLVSYEYDSL